VHEKVLLSKNMAPGSRAVSISSSSDPRDPSAEVPYKAPKIKEEELPPSWFGLLAILTGVFGILVRVSDSGRLLTFHVLETGLVLPIVIGIRV
jgi:hypothetical protein